MDELVPAALVVWREELHERLVQNSGRAIVPDRIQAVPVDQPRIVTDGKSQT
jgi:hypothetical protein